MKGFIYSLLGVSIFFSVFAIGCDKKDEFTPKLEVELASIGLPATASSSSTFSIASNTDWAIDCQQDWLTVSPLSGSKDAEVTITATENSAAESRVATLTVSVDDLDPVIVTVTQNGTLGISASSLNIEATDKLTSTFYISSENAWSVNSTDEWISVDITEGSGNTTITVSASENTSLEVRTAEITVSEEGSEPKVITITQEGAEPFLSISEYYANLTSEANSSITISLTSNISWSVSGTEDWFSVEPMSGTGNAEIVISTTDERMLGAPITKSISISGESVNKKRIKVTQEGMPCADEDETPCNTSGCTVADMPSYSALPDNPKLPDPFTFMDGSPVVSKADWECRRQEIAVMAMEYEYGYKPCTPYEYTTGEFNGNTITVTVSDGKKTISFDCMITYPSTGSGPYPAMIALGWSTLNNTLLSDLGIAVISFPNDELGEQQGANSRGQGKFYDFFCADQTSGALMAWAWGASRLIDALEKTPEANIDVSHLGVTGCSRNGKGALCIGAFDDRIALTVPQEPGSGGSTSWRVSDDIFENGENTQTLRQIVTENTWFRYNFSQFSSTATKLPFDHHMIQGLVAPRGLLIIENDILWLGPESSWVCANAAQTIFQALGVPNNMGYSGTNEHGHCGFPDSQNPELEAYVRKFLLDETDVETSIMKSEPGYEYNKDNWVDWDIPTLD